MHAWRQQGQKHPTVGHSKPLRPEYPPLLCQRMADLLAEDVHLPLPQATATTSSTSRRVLGHQVKQAPPLVPASADIVKMLHGPAQPNHSCLTSHVQGQDTEMDQQKDQEHGGKKAKKSFKVRIQQGSERDGKKATETFRVGIQQEPKNF